MSCEIRHIAQLQDIKKCKNSIFTEDYQCDNNWLQESLVSFSPTGEILVIAKGNKLVLLTSKWDSFETGDVKMKYYVTWEGIPCNKSGVITSVLCLPLLSHGQSASGADWTCIILGFSSGTIKFYTENMHLLLSDVLHAEPILHIKSNSLRPSCQQGTANAINQDSNESIYVLYKSVMCIINGFSIFQTLKGCRNRLARQSASLEGLELDTSIPIHFKKYNFADQDSITDACFVGQTLVNTFDHFMNASLTEVFDCNQRTSPPQTSLIIATGRKPFLGFHFTVEGGGSAVLADVALAVASKIKTRVAATLPGWFGFGNSEPEKMKAAQEPGEQLRCRFGLCDLWRNGNTIITSPDFKLSAITDSLGRIFLIENSSGIARRLWKGYREAQCGFLEVEEDVDKSKHKKQKSEINAVPRRARFIVIYAPKKGLIEIFVVQQGPCVATFKVSKHGTLIYTPYGLLGFNNPISKGVSTSQYPVVFLSEEGIKEIVVPFHCALRSNNSCKARDLHILKKIKFYLKENQSDDLKFDSDIKEFAKDLKTDEIKIQLIEMLMLHKNITPTAFAAVLNVFLENNKAEEESCNFSRSFILFVETLEKLINFYVFIRDLNNQPPGYKTVSHTMDDDSLLAESLLLTRKEMDCISTLITFIANKENKEKRNAKVTFLVEDEASLTKFLSCFDFNSLCDFSSELENKKVQDLNFKKDLNEEEMNWIGGFLFKGIFYSDEWINDWKIFVSENKLNCLDLLKSLIFYWLNKNLPENVTFEVVSLLELIKAICLMVDPGKIYTNSMNYSNWWQSIRNFLKARPCNFNGLLAAFVCRAATRALEQLKESELKLAPEREKRSRELKTDPDLSQNNEWENVSQDTWEWDILITKLEDLTLLNSVLKIKFKNIESFRPIIDFDTEEFSLNYILERGEGFISELVAKWLIQFGLDPLCLIDSNDVEFRVQKSNSDKGLEFESSFKKDDPDIEEAICLKENDLTHAILEYVTVLKEKFPYSLTSSSLISNICWEYVAYWFRNGDQLDCLESSVVFLHSIPCVNIKHGLSYLCWTTYIVNKFAAVAKLINKFGKVPKDKFCNQEVNLTNIQVPVFLKFSTEILNIMLETGNAEKDEFIINQEGIWQNEAVKNAKSLIKLALSHPKLNEKLVLLHYQLSLSLYMISELKFKVPKLFSTLFDNMAQTEFFADFAKNSSLSSHSCNAILINSRKKFLYRAVAGAVQAIEVIESIPRFPLKKSSEYQPETCTNVEKATLWLSYSFQLARMWNIPLDSLRRQHICELYSSGYDRLAEEVLPAVNECSALASQLLVIAGKRFKVYIDGSSKLSKQITNLSPNISTWLECLDSESLKSYSVNLDDLYIMLSYILKYHPEKADEENLALAMTESVSILKADG